MKIPIVSDILGIINKNFPFASAESWDNVGLQVGDPSIRVKRVMVALDPLPEVIERAAASGCQLLVTHHPLIFSPLRNVTTSSDTGRLVLKAASSGLALIAMHTNYDLASGGLNDVLAEKLGLVSLKPLNVSGAYELVKLVVFVPADAMPDVRQAMFGLTESIGNYSNCSFSASGEGTFLPLDGATPAIGSVGVLEKVQEQRLELLVRRDRLAAVVKRLVSVHPYEEPAFDCYPLLNDGIPFGFGRIGTLASPVSLSEYAATVKSVLGCDFIRVVGDDLSKMVKKVAICSGSGASMLKDAVRGGADLLVTGDMKYHDARNAQSAGISVIDAGHFATERIMIPAVTEFLREAASISGFDLEVVPADNEKEPFVLCS